MTWLYIVAICVAVIIICGILSKVFLKQKLDSIDGLGKIVTEKKDKNVISSFGDEES